MAVKPFYGVLDPPKVRPFAGTLDSGQSVGPPPAGGTMFAPGDEALTRAGVMQRTAAEASEIESRIPMIERNSFQQGVMPVAGGLAGLFVPGSKALAIAGQSALAGGGAGLGELMRQKSANEPFDFQKASSEAVGTGAGNLAFGLGLKGLGKLAEKLFRSPLSAPQEAAAGFAREKGVPFPLSSAAPASGAGRLQRATTWLLPGEMRSASDANRVAEFLNREVSTITAKTAVFDEAVRAGQSWFARLVNPAKSGTTEAWKTYTAAMGPKTRIAIPETVAAAREAADSLRASGAVAGQKGDELFTMLDGFLSANSSARTTQELNAFAGNLISKGMKGKTKDLADEVMAALNREIVGAAKAKGSTAGDQFLAGLAAREKYRKLAQIPEVERLAGELGTGGQKGTKGTYDWMNTLFTKGNGKALALIRKEEPQLYKDLADAWLARAIKTASKYDQSTMGPVIDGPALRRWYESNADTIKVVLGGEQAKALDNFTLYAKYMDRATREAAPASSDVTKAFGKGMTLGRASAEAYAISRHPIMVPLSEAGSFVFARGLSDPSSRLFKVFTKGFDPATRAMMLRTGGVVGQEVGRQGMTKFGLVFGGDRDRE